MKDLNYKELLAAPALVQQVYLSGVRNQTIGIATYQQAIKNHPEYFQEEIEHRKKYDAIPSEVHEKYYDELSKIRQEFFKDIPLSKGILYWVKHREESESYSKLYREAEEKFKPIGEALHKKYYSKYGLTQ